MTYIWKDWVFLERNENTVAVKAYESPQTWNCNKANTYTKEYIGEFH